MSSQQGPIACKYTRSTCLHSRLQWNTAMYIVWCWAFLRRQSNAAISSTGELHTSSPIVHFRYRCGQTAKSNNFPDCAAMLYPHVARRQCKVCPTFIQQLRSSKNYYSNSWIYSYYSHAIFFGPPKKMKTLTIYTQHFSTDYKNELPHTCFYIGSVVFLVGFVIHLHFFLWMCENIPHLD